MRSLAPEIIAALAARTLVARDFLWIVARDRATGDPVTDGNWSDVGKCTAAVINPDTGAPETRTWNGSGGLISVSDVPLLSNMTVRRVSVRMSQVNDRVQALIRQYDCKQARVELYRGIFNPATRRLVSPAPPRFVGFVDNIEIKTPAENEEGFVNLDCVSHTQEMTRSNPDTRSHESQILRNPVDDFFKDAAVVGDWEHFWGKASGVVPAASTGGKGFAA